MIRVVGSLPSLMLASLLAAVPPAAAQPDPSAVCTALEQRIAELGTLLGRVRSGDIGAETIAHMARWRDSFEAKVHDTSLAEFVLASATGAGGGAAAQLFVTGATNPLVVGLGTMFTQFAAATYTGIRNLAEWPQINANTAFYQWVLDHVEHGREGPVDEHLRNFMAVHRDALRAIVGSPPPPGASDTAIRRYLAANAVPLLYYFGRFEEVHGAGAFARFKINDRRYAVGYYREIVPPALSRAIQAIRNDLDRIRLKATCGATGVWETSYGRMYIELKDGAVRGVYDYRDGVVTGTYGSDSRTLTGHWIQSVSDRECRGLREGSPWWGGLTFRFSEDLRSFSGGWDHCGDPEATGSWNGAAVR